MELFTVGLRKRKRIAKAQKMHENVWGNSQETRTIWCGLACVTATLAVQVFFQGGWQHEIDADEQTRGG